MEQLDLLEQELKMLLENIERVKSFKKENEGNRYRLSNSNVIGELKHRMIALKQRLTLAGKINTYDYLKSK